MYSYMKRFIMRNWFTQKEFTRNFNSEINESGDIRGLRVWLHL